MRTTIALAGLFLLLGCSNTLETGYEPRRLGASDTARRSYYAAPFTPESKAGQNDKQQEMQQRRPTNY